MCAATRDTRSAATISRDHTRVRQGKLYKLRLCVNETDTERARLLRVFADAGQFAQVSSLWFSPYRGHMLVPFSVLSLTTCDRFPGVRELRVQCPARVGGRSGLRTLVHLPQLQDLTVYDDPPLIGNFDALSHLQVSRVRWVSCAVVRRAGLPRLWRCVCVR